jgi:hypothetical protein
VESQFAELDHDAGLLWSRFLRVSFDRNLRRKVKKVRK